MNALRDFVFARADICEEPIFARRRLVVPNPFDIRSETHRGSKGRLSPSGA
jgi:hypothetical protein